MIPIIVIVGPTASGKTDLSIELAQKINGECINFDSTQMFKYNDIATNKINDKDKKGIEHHLLSFLEPCDFYSVADFQRDCREKIDFIIKKNKVPILVGGTGLYIDAVLKKYNFVPSEHNTWVDDRSETNKELWDILNSLDPNDASKIHINNRKRILRSLQINEISNSNKSNLILNNKEFYYENVIIVGLNPKREILYKNINERVIKLLDLGLLNEMKNLYQMTKKSNSQSLKCIGGPETIYFINNEISYDNYILLMQKNNRNYARKQITWFKNKLPETIWFEHNYDNFEQIKIEIIDFIIKKKF